LIDPNTYSSRIPKRGYRRWEKAGIRSLKGSELFDSAFGLYRQNGLELLRLLAVPATVAFGLFLLAWEFVGKRLFFVGGESATPIQEAGEMVGLLFFGTACAAPLILLAYSYMSGAATLYMSDVYLGRRPNISAIHRQVMRRLLSLAALNFVLMVAALATLLIGFAFLFGSALIDSSTSNNEAFAGVVSLLGVIGILAGIVLFPVIFIRLSLAPVALLAEGLGPIAAIKRSTQLMSGKSAYNPQMIGSASPGPTVLMLLLTTLLLQLLLWGSLQIPASLLEQYLLSQGVAAGSAFLKTLYAALSLFGGFASFILTHPFFVAGIALVYFNRRIYSEAFDIDLLAQSIWKHDRSVDFDL